MSQQSSKVTVAEKKYLVSTKKKKEKLWGQKSSSWESNRGQKEKYVPWKIVTGDTLCVLLQRVDMSTCNR